MNYTLEEKYNLIKEEIIQYKDIDPIKIAKAIMKRNYINIHGPEHHFLDGASFLVAYKNAGGDIDLEASLNTLAERTIKMPGATCGFWGVCGSVSSLGAAMSVIHKTSFLSNDQYYKDHMEYTSKTLMKMSEIGGPRCCKRNAFISISNAVRFMQDKYNVHMEVESVKCEFSNLNAQCIKERCPYFKKNN